MYLKRQYIAHFINLLGTRSFKMKKFSKSKVKQACVPILSRSMFLCSIFQIQRPMEACTSDLMYYFCSQVGSNFVVHSAKEGTMVILSRWLLTISNVVVDETWWFGRLSLLVCNMRWRQKPRVSVNYYCCEITSLSCKPLLRSYFDSGGWVGNMDASVSLYIYKFFILKLLVLIKKKVS